MEDRARRGMVSRTFFSSGPWDRESDWEQWEAKSGFPCLAIRTSVGSLCGYVGVRVGHRCFGLHYEDVEYIFRSEVSPYTAKLSYSGRSTMLISAMFDPEEDADVWWLGFDCGHEGDCLPILSEDGRYHDMESVKHRVEELGWVIRQIGKWARGTRMEAL